MDVILWGATLYINHLIIEEYLKSIPDVSDMNLKIFSISKFIALVGTITLLFPFSSQLVLLPMVIGFHFLSLLVFSTYCLVKGLHIVRFHFVGSHCTVDCR